MSSGIPAINIDWGPKIKDKLVYIELSSSENVLINPYLLIENGKNASIFLKHILLGFDNSTEKLIRVDKTIPADSKETIVVIDKEDTTHLQLPHSNPSSIKLTLNISPFHNQPIVVIPLAKANLVQNE